jgi:hypothetical protein
VSKPTACAVSDGATIRAGEILGADLAYLGTRFIATVESMAPEEYKNLLVTQTSSDLMYTGKVAGVPANWLTESIRRVGLDPANLPEPLGKGMRHDHLPESAQPWKSIWSAGQGIDLIKDIPTVKTLVERLRLECSAACKVPDMSKAARLVDEVRSSLPAAMTSTSQGAGCLSVRLPTLVVNGFAGPRPIVRRAFPYHRWHSRVTCGAARRRRHRKDFILGEREMMTPARAGKALAAAPPNSRTVVLGIGR